MTSYIPVAEQILAAVGGKDNVVHATHCATRLRLNLKDDSCINDKQLNMLPDVVTVVNNGSQFQIVIGAKVEYVFAAMSTLLTDDNALAGQPAQKASLFNRMLATLSAIFTPYIGVLAGVGVVKGLVVLLQTMEIISTKSWLFVVLSALSGGVFVMLPLFIAVTAAGRFRTSRFTALALTAAMVFPLTDAAMADSITIFHLTLPLKIYGGAVIPAIFAFWFLSHVERRLKKMIPEVAALVFVPCLSLLVCGFVVLTVIGPVASYIGTGIADGYTLLYNLSPALSGALLAGIGQLFVVFGVHWHHSGCTHQHAGERLRHGDGDVYVCGDGAVRRGIWRHLYCPQPEGQTAGRFCLPLCVLWHHRTGAVRRESEISHAVYLRLYRCRIRRSDHRFPEGQNIQLSAGAQCL